VDQTAWLERIGAIRQWQASGIRAPHKPLLVLYALGQSNAPGRVECDSPTRSSR